MLASGGRHGGACSAARTRRPILSAYPDGRCKVNGASRMKEAVGGQTRIEHVHVDLQGAYATMTRPFPDGADVVAVLEATSLESSGTHGHRCNPPESTPSVPRCACPVFGHRLCRHDPCP